MKVSRIILVVLFLASPALAGLTFNWVYDPVAGYGANVTDPKLGADGTVAWYGPANTATWNGPDPNPAPPDVYHDFDITELGLPGAGVPGGPVTETNSLSVPNSNGYYVVGKTIAAPDPMMGAWAYTSVGWTQLGDGLSRSGTVSDSNEDYAVVNGIGGKVGTVALNGAGAAVLTPLPDTPTPEARNGRISDSGEYITHWDGGWLEARIHYGANWATSRVLGDLNTGMNHAFDVNDSGNVVGWTHLNGGQAMFYNFATDTLSNIPDGPFTGQTLVPKAINNLNQVVGTVDDTADLFYYDYATNTTVNVWDLVDGEDGVNFSPINGTWIQWGSPQYVAGINDDGWITGRLRGETPWGGPKDGVFLLTPEPATLMVLFAGASLALLRRRK